MKRPVTHLRVVESDPMPAWVPEPPRPSVGPALLMWAGAVLGGWCFVAGLAWTAHAICNVTGIIRP